MDVKHQKYLAAWRSGHGSTCKVEIDRQLALAQASRWEKRISNCAFTASVDVELGVKISPELLHYLQGKMIDVCDE